MAAASEAFAAPVISGNVSLYNESRGRDIYPTPIIGALGLLDDVTAHATMAFKKEGDIVVLLGSDEVRGDAASLAGSEYLEIVHDKVAGRPTIDLDLEAAVQRVCRKAIAQSIVNSAHDCSDGGLAVALAESCIAGNIGFIASFETTGRWDAALFGETESRIVVSLPEDWLTQLRRLCSGEGVPTVVLGRVGGSRLNLGNNIDLDLHDADDAWSGGLERAVGGSDSSLGSRL